MAKANVSTVVAGTQLLEFRASASTTARRLQLEGYTAANVRSAEARWKLILADLPRVVPISKQLDRVLGGSIVPGSVVLIEVAIPARGKADIAIYKPL